MEKLKLPPGFRFHPMDEELVFQYLKRKVFSCPLPAPIILEVDVGKSDPWDFPVSFVLLQSHMVLGNNMVVLCHIFLKKRGDGKNEEDQVQDRVVKKRKIFGPVLYDFMKTAPQVTNTQQTADMLFLG
ncbi:hypothetical protein M0R45_001921 [Rubus argutus]|uniref:NAC domain-containing protein n=1 Tax=Rubus argutus TaxID=59490 RepID=A0AAW1VKB8_RUBAR